MSILRIANDPEPVPIYFIDAKVPTTLPQSTSHDVRGVVREIDSTEFVDEIPEKSEFFEIQSRPCVVQQIHVTPR